MGNKEKSKRKLLPPHKGKSSIKGGKSGGLTYRDTHRKCEKVPVPQRKEKGERKKKPRGRTY